MQNIPFTFMVNNTSKRAYILRSLLFFFFLIALISKTQAQNISKYYTTYTQENGAMFFIQPKEEFKNKKTKQDLVYDLTYLTSKDSVSLKFTFTDLESRTIDSISLTDKEKRITGKTKKLFIDVKKKYWLHRYATELALDDLSDFYSEAVNPMVIVYYSGKTAELSIKDKKWKKESEVISKILNLAEQNKNH